MEKGKEDEGKEDDNIRSLQNYIKLLCSDISGIQTNEKTNENFERLYRYYFLLFIHRIYNYYIIYYINEPIIKKLKEKFKGKELPLIIKINKLKGDISKSTSDKTRFENESEKLDSDRILILKKSESYLKATELANKETEIDNKKKEIDIEDNKIISYKSVINYIENQLRLNNITDAKIKAPTINIDHLNQVIIELDNLSIVYIDIINLIVNQISPPPNDKEYIKNYLNLMNDKVQDQEIQRQRKGFFIYLINNIIYYYITLDNKESDCNEKIWVIFDNRYIKFSEFTMEAPPENMQCTQVTTFIKKLFKEKVDLFDLTNQIIKYEHNYLDICKENKSRVSLTEAEKSKDYIDRKIRFETDFTYSKSVKEAEKNVKEAENDVEKAEKDVEKAKKDVELKIKEDQYKIAKKSFDDAKKSHDDAKKSHDEAKKSFDDAKQSLVKARSSWKQTAKSKDHGVIHNAFKKVNELETNKNSAEEIEKNARNKLLEAINALEEAKKSLDDIFNRINKPLNDAKKKLSTMNETLEKAKKNAIYAYENVGSIYEKAYAAYIIAYHKFDNDRINVTYQIQLRNTIHEYNRILFGLLSKYIDINFNDKIEKIKLKIKSYITIIKKYLDICKNSKIDITKLNEAEIKLDRLLNNLGGSVKTQMKKAIDLIFSYTDVSLNKSIITVIELDRKIYNIYNDILSTTTELKLLKQKYERTNEVSSEKLAYYQIMAPIIGELDYSLYKEEHYYKESLSILTKIVEDIGTEVSINTIRERCVDLINERTFISDDNWGIPTIYYNKALNEISEKVNKYNLFLINLKNNYKFKIDEYYEKVDEYNKLIEDIKKIVTNATKNRDSAIKVKEEVDKISRELNVKVISLKAKFIEKIINRIKLLEQKKSDIVDRQLGVYEKKDKFKEDDIKFKDESTSFIKERVIEDRYKRNFERFIDQLDRYRGIDEKNKGILPEDTRELNKRLTDYFSKLNNKEYEIDAGKYNKNAEGKYYYNELNLHLDIELKYWVIKNAVNKHKIDEEIKLLRGIREFLNKTIEEQETEILPFINKGDVEGGDIKTKLYIFFKVVNEVEILASISYDSEEILSIVLKDLLTNVKKKKKEAERDEKEAVFNPKDVYYDVLYDVIIDDFIRQGDQISPQTIIDITDTVTKAARVPDQIGDAQRTQDITDTVTTAARVPDQIGDAQRTQQQLQDITDTVTTAARVPDQIGDAQRTQDITDTVTTAARVPDQIGDALRTQDITDTVTTATRVTDALRTQDITDTVNTATRVTDALLTQDITDTVNTATRVTDQIGEIAEGTEGEGSKNNEDNKNKKKGNIPFQTPRKYSINDDVLRGRYYTTGLYKDVTSEDIGLAREYKDDNGSKIIYKQGAIKDMLKKIDEFNYNQKGGDIINEINRFENDINNPIEAFEIRFEDRLVFIIVTFFIRYVAISIIQRGIDSNMVKSFYEGFIYYGGIYILLFWFIVFFVNIDNNYTIDYIDLNNLEIYIRTIFYYFYMGTNGISRLIIHSLLIIIIIIIPIILNTKNRKAKDTLNDDDKDKMELLTLEERTKLSKALSLFTLFIWILTSIIATKF